MKIIDNSKIIDLGIEASKSQRKRTNFNLHDTSDDTIQRMINVLQPGTYLCPHKHQTPPKREVFVILRGRLLVIIFDDKGVIYSSIILDKDEGNFLIEIPPNTFHTIIPLAVNTAVFECKDGPYNPDTDKIFAEWAPSEDSNEGLFYIEKIFKDLGLNFPKFL